MKEDKVTSMSKLSCISKISKHIVKEKFQLQHKKYHAIGTHQICNRSHQQQHPWTSSLYTTQGPEVQLCSSAESK